MPFFFFFFFFFLGNFYTGDTEKEVYYFYIQPFSLCHRLYKKKFKKYIYNKILTASVSVTTAVSGSCASDVGSGADSKLHS